MLNTIYVEYNIIFINNVFFIQEGLPASREYTPTGNIVFNFLDG
jgi:hypothetical protein